MLSLLSHAPEFFGQQQGLTKPVLLLSYLALQQTWVARSSLAMLLRPDSPEAAARHYLRLLLNRAKALPWAAALEVEPQRLRFFVCQPMSTPFKMPWQNRLDGGTRTLLSPKYSHPRTVPIDFSCPLGSCASPDSSLGFAPSPFGGSRPRSATNPAQPSQILGGDG